MKNRTLLAGEPEPGEAVRDEDRREDRADRAQDARSPNVLNSSRGKLSCDQAVVKFANSRRESSRPARGSASGPASRSGWRSGRPGRRRRLLRGLPRRASGCGRPVDRDRVDRVLLALVGPGLRRRRLDGAPGVEAWRGCWNAVVTMYSSGIRNALMMITANMTATPWPGTAGRLRATGPSVGERAWVVRPRASSVIGRRPRSRRACGRTRTGRGSGPGPAANSSQAIAAP